MVVRPRVLVLLSLHLLSPCLRRPFVLTHLSVRSIADIHFPYSTSVVHLAPQVRMLLCFVRFWHSLPFPRPELLLTQEDIIMSSTSPTVFTLFSGSTFSSVPLLA